MSKLNLVKNQHYIPQGYLRKFQINSKNKDRKKAKVYVLDVDNLKILKKRIEKICSEHYFYEVDKDAPNNELEDYISKYIEVPFYNRVYPNGLLNIQNIFDSKTKGHLAFYLAFQISRTDKFREMAAEINSWAFKGAYQILKEKGMFNNDIPENKIKFSIDKQLSHLETLKNFPFNEISRFFLQKKWVILEAKENSKIKFCAYSSGVSLDSYTQIHFFPLSKDYCLALYPNYPDLKNNCILPADSKMISYANDVGKNCSKQVFSSNEESLFNLKK
ncbi:DUF4238 domain-containing protein [Psychrilyobacter atlanticus]|uniref:DUF4238 domain-containing protein n=1 Tax=Psychrilyobacter atlanticus TaxID=271091 RepID=UPI0003F6DC1A|nr:DUF4238 domain-containing protein [Psychrilyobacter atlanticus]